MRTPDDIEAAFTYHPPGGDQPERYERLRQEAKVFAHSLFRMCPESAERTLALRELENAVMWANKSIALEASRA